MRSLGMVGMADRRALRATSCQEQIEKFTMGERIFRQKSTTFSFVSVTSTHASGSRDFTVISTTPKKLIRGGPCVLKAKSKVSFFRAFYSFLCFDS